MNRDRTDVGREGKIYPAKILAGIKYSVGQPILLEFADYNLLLDKAGCRFMDFTRVFKIKICFNLVRIGLGCVFIIAAVPKILHPADFANAVFNYQILPLLLINPFALVLPWIELAVGLLLVTGWWLESAVVLADILLFVFLAVAGFNLARGLNINCGCFGSGGAEQAAGIVTFFRDLALLLGGLYLLGSIICRSNSGRI